MFGLIHLIEEYPKEYYVKTILSNIKFHIEERIFWLDALINRIFNDNRYFSIFKENIHLSDKKSIIKIFNYMMEESPHHKEKIENLKNEIT
jgi:hypothetical protein